MIQPVPDVLVLLSTCVTYPATMLAIVLGNQRIDQNFDGMAPFRPFDDAVMAAQRPVDRRPRANGSHED